MPAKNVKAYVKRKKNHAADAICEAVRCPTMRRAGQIGRAAGPVDAASNARSADMAANLTYQCLAGAYGRARHLRLRKGVKGSKSC
jgi:hypothetical protein